MTLLSQVTGQEESGDFLRTNTDPYAQLYGGRQKLEKLDAKAIEVKVGSDTRNLSDSKKNKRSITHNTTLKPQHESVDHFLLNDQSPYFVVQPPKVNPLKTITAAPVNVKNSACSLKQPSRQRASSAYQSRQIRNVKKKKAPSSQVTLRPNASAAAYQSHSSSQFKITLSNDRRNICFNNLSKLEKDVFRHPDAVLGENHVSAAQLSIKLQTNGGIELYNAKSA